MRYLLLATILLAGIAISADCVEARGRGIQRPLPIPKGTWTTVAPRQAGIMRPAEFVIVRTPRPPSKR